MVIVNNYCVLNYNILLTAIFLVEEWPKWHQKCLFARYVLTCFKYNNKHYVTKSTKLWYLKNLRYTTAYHRN